MKKFYKNKKILIAVTSLMLCFNLCSKTMAMDHEKNNFMDTINEFANKTEQANITNLDEEPKDLIKQINDFADKTKQANTTTVNTEKNKQNEATDLTNKIIDFYKSDNVVNKINSIVDKTKQANITNLDEEPKDLIKQINDFADKTKQANTTTVNTEKNKQNEATDLPNKIIDFYKSDNVVNKINSIVDKTEQANITDLDEETKDLIKQINDFANKTKQANITDLDEKTKDLIKQINNFADTTKQANTTTVNTEKKKQNEATDLTNKIIDSDKNSNIVNKIKFKIVKQNNNSTNTDKQAKTTTINNDNDNKFANTTEQANITDLDEKTKDLIKQINDFADKTKQNATTNLTNKKRKGNKNRSKKLNLINEKLENLTLIYLIEDLFSDDLIMSTETMPISPDIRAKLEEIHESVYIHEPFDNDRCDEYEHFFTNCIESLNKILNKDVQISHDYFDIFLKPLCIFKEKTKHEDEVINDIYALNKIINVLEPSSETKPIFEKTLNKMLKNSSKKIILKNNVKPSFDNLNIKIKYDNLDNDNEIVEDNNNLINLNKKTYTDEELNLPNLGTIKLPVKHDRSPSDKYLETKNLTINENMKEQLKNAHIYILKQQALKKPFENDNRTCTRYNRFVEKALHYLEKFFPQRNVRLAYFLKFLKPLLNFKNDPTDKELNLPSEETIKLFLNKLNISGNINQNENNKINEDYIKEIKNKLRIVYKIIFKDKKFVSKNSKIYIDFKNYIIDRLNSIFKNITVANDYYYKFIKPLLLFWFDVETNPENIKINTPDEDIALNMPSGLIMDDDVRTYLRNIHEYIKKQDPFPTKYDSKYRVFIERCKFHKLKPIFNGDLELAKKYLREYLIPLLKIEDNNIYKNEKQNKSNINNDNKRLKFFSKNKTPTDEELNLPNTGKITLKFKSSKNKEATTTEKTIELSPETITQLRKVHNLVYFHKPFSSNEIERYKYYKDYILQKKLKPIFNSYEVAKAYYNKYLEIFFNNINDIKNNNNNINKIVDISENFDEEHFNRLFNLPKTGPITLPVKQIYGEKPVVISINQNDMEPLKEIHIKAFIESLKIKQLESYTTYKCVSYSNFKKDICECLEKIFNSINIAHAYFKKYLKPLLEKYTDEELNLPKAGTTITDENKQKKLKKAHIHAIERARKIGTFKSDNTNKCADYKNFKNNICAWLKDIFNSTKIARAYFEKFIKPLCDFKEQKNKNNNNNNIIDIDENQNNNIINIDENINKTVNIAKPVFNINSNISQTSSKDKKLLQKKTKNNGKLEN